jgi:ATP synthase (C/AC39) subunit
MSNPADWCFVCGLVNAQSERLMDQRSIMGLFEADSPEELRGRLRTSLLFSATPPGERPLDELPERFEETVLQIAHASPDVRVGDFFILEGWWERFRTYAKERVIGKSADARTGQPEGSADALSPLFRDCWDGIVDDDRLQPFADAADAVRRGVDGVDDIVGTIDSIVDPWEAAALNRCAIALNSSDLTSWVAQWVSLRAGLCITRARSLEWNLDRMISPWSDTGVDVGVLKELAHAKREDLAGIWERLGLSHAQEALDSREPTMALSQKIDARVSSMATDALGIPFGPEPVFAFLWAARNECKNLKLVLTALSCGMAEDDVVGDLRN